MNRERYWATEQGETLAAAVEQRFQDFRSFVRGCGMEGLWRRLYATFYFSMAGPDGVPYSAFGLHKRGAKLNVLKSHFPHFTDLVGRYVDLVDGQRHAPVPVADTEEYEAEREVKLAKGVLDRYMREGLEASLKEWVGLAGALGLSYHLVHWDDYGGDTLPAPPPEEGMQPMGPSYTGTVRCRALLPWNVAVNPKAPGHQQQHVRWYVLRLTMSRWEAMQRWPESSEELRRQEPSQDDWGATAWSFLTPDSSLAVNDDTISVYLFLHADTLELPGGRVAWVLDAKRVLEDSTLAGAGMPRATVEPLAADWIHGTPWGYSRAWMLLAAQEAYNIIRSMGITSRVAHGMPLLVTPKGSGVRATALGQGPALIEYNPGQKPELLNFQATPMGGPEHEGSLREEMETLSSVNSTVRGNPPPNIETGPAAAYMGSVASQANEKFRLNIAMGIEATCGDVLALFQARGELPLQVELGESGERRPEEVVGTDISRVRRVHVEMGNPLLRSHAGRIMLAQELMKLPPGADTGAFLRVLETGRLEPLTKKSESSAAYIQSENEALGRGEVPPVALTDNPLEHVPQHAMALNDPRNRANPEVMQAVITHINQHVQVWQQGTLTNPGVLEAAGIPPMQSAMAMLGGMAPPPPEGEGGQPGPPAGPMQPATPQQALPRLPGGDAVARGINPLAPGPGGGPQQ